MCLMIYNLKPYPAYKDSGVEWLGQVPAHWELKPLKRWVRINANVLPDTTPADYEFRYIEIGTVGTGFLTREPQRLRFGIAPSRARRVLHIGDTIISTVRTYLKAVYYVDEDAEALVCSTGFAVLTPGPSTQPKYVSYLVQSNTFTDRVTAESVGTAYPAIAEGRLGSFYVPMPPLPEQNAIVRFLDWTERRIRRYIRAKQKLIKLLEEYKQALIHQAVTGQIDVRTGQPYPAYKPSGVPWLGDVPEHWEVRRVKTAVSNINEQTSTKNDEDLCIALEHVESWTGRLLVASGEAQFDSQVKCFRAGDVLFGKLRPYLAKVVRPKQSGVCVGEFFVLRARPVVSPHYLEVVLRSARAIDFVDSSTYGAKMPRANWTFVGAMLFPLPPLPEQTAIVEYLDAQITKIDAATAAARREIKLLREYRTRLISDVVTGKMDVREVAARLPEELSEEEAESMDAGGIVEDEATDDDTAAETLSEEEAEP